MFTVASRYHIVRPLGSGGMGAVYEALHSGTGRRVAVKLLHHDAAARSTDRERFVREARLAGALTSPHIAQVLDAGTDETSCLPYIAMELIDGENLQDLLVRRSKLPVGLVLVIAAQVARGLAEAHDADIIHRDVKPANVMLTRDAEDRLLCKLVDFGVARSVTGDTVTTSGGLVGSLPYMAPEQMLGGTLDPTIDLWSLGAFMYEALSGRRASGDAGLAIGELVARVCTKDAPPLLEIAPWVPQGVAAIVHKALSRERARRFQSAGELERAILALLPAGARVASSALEDGSDIVVLDDDASAPGASSRRRGRRVWLSLVSVAAALTVFGGAVGVHGAARADAQHPRVSLEPPADVSPVTEAPRLASEVGTDVGAPPAASPSSGSPELEGHATIARAEGRRREPPRAVPVSPTKRVRKPSSASPAATATSARDPLDHM